MAVETPDAERKQSRPKAVLICPTCGHESGPAGDWLARRRDTVDGAKLALVCPICDTDITHRPLGEAKPQEDPLVPSC